MTTITITLTESKAIKYLKEHPLRNSFEHWDEIFTSKNKYSLMIPEKLIMRKIYPHYDYFNPIAGRHRFYPIDQKTSLEALNEFEEEINLSASGIDLRSGFFTKPESVWESYDDQKKMNGFWEKIDTQIDHELSMILHQLCKDSEVFMVDMLNNNEVRPKFLKESTVLEVREIGNHPAYKILNTNDPATVSKYINCLARPESFIVFVSPIKISTPEEMLESSSTIIVSCCDGEAYLLIRNK